MDVYTNTSGDIAQKVPCQPDLIRQYSNMGLIQCRRLPNGTRLFSAEVVERVREIKAKRLANRGIKHAA